MGSNTPLEVHRVADEPLTPLGYEQIADLSSAVGLSPPTGAKFAIITPKSEAIRWRDDGTDPTAGAGMPIADGDSIWYIGNLGAIKIIEQAGSAELNVSYYGF